MSANPIDLLKNAPRTDYVLPDGRQIIHVRGDTYKLMSIHGSFERYLHHEDVTVAPTIAGQRAKPVKPDQGMRAGTLDVL